MNVEAVRRREPWLRSMVDFYLTAMRTQMQTQFQYRIPMYMYTLGMAAEPTIYLVVWSSIARSHGGSVNGITAHSWPAGCDHVGELPHLTAELLRRGWNEDALEKFLAGNWQRVFRDCLPPV